MKRPDRDKHSSLFDPSISNKEKCFMMLDPGASVIKYIFNFITDNLGCVFVHVKPFHISLISVSKAGAYSS